MIAVTKGNLGAADIDTGPEMILADAGYCSEANLQWITGTESNVLVATGRIKDGERVPETPRGRTPPHGRCATSSRGPEGLGARFGTASTVG
jgi:hypothetical protein